MSTIKTSGNRLQPYVDAQRNAIAFRHKADRVLRLEAGDVHTLRRLCEVQIVTRELGQFMTDRELSSALSMMNQATRREVW